MAGINIPYGMPQVGGTMEIPRQIPGPPGFGSMPDPNAPEQEGIPHAKPNPQIRVTDGALAPIGMEAVISGTVTEHKAEGLIMSCNKDLVGGIQIDGNSRYQLKEAKIALSGNCINDFEGNGAAIQVLGTATVEIADAEIVVDGVLRSCINANKYANLYVRGCKGA